MTTERDGEQERDDRLGAAVRRRLDDVPPDVADRLGAMRRAAVADLERRRQPAVWRRPVWLAGTGAAAAALALAVMVATRPSDPQPGGLLLADADELAVVAELEVLEELEFLAWLEQEALDDGQG